MLILLFNVIICLKVLTLSFEDPQIPLKKNYFAIDKLPTTNYKFHKPWRIDYIARTYD
jgi:hypothetical protein